MGDEKQRRFRFSLKALLAIVTVLAVGLGGWIAYSNYKLRQLVALRDQGVIIILRDRTPKAIQAIGIKHLHPFYSVPTVELYVTAKGADALVRSGDELLSGATARERILVHASEARKFGAKDIQLILLDGFDRGWMQFASENSMSVISDSKARYLTRLKANQESGANVNP